MPEDATVHKRENGFVAQLFFWIGLAFCLLAIYALSTGPMFKLALAHQPTWMPVVDKLYAPVAWACYRSNRAQRLLDWYLLNIWHLHSDRDAR